MLIARAGLGLVRSQMHGICLSRQLATSRSNCKALKNWKRPSIGELGVPREPWQRVHDRNQRKFNTHLATGLVAIGFTGIVLVNTVFFNSTPEFLRSTGFKTLMPGVVESSAAEEEDEEGGGGGDDGKEEVNEVLEAEDVKELDQPAIAAPSIDDGEANDDVEQIEESPDSSTAPASVQKESDAEEPGSNDVAAAEEAAAEKTAAEEAAAAAAKEAAEKAAAEKAAAEKAAVEKAAVEKATAEKAAAEEAAAIAAAEKAAEDALAAEIAKIEAEEAAKAEGVTAAQVAVGAAGAAAAVVSSPPALTPTPDTQEFPPKVVNEREAEKTGVPSHVPYLLIGAGTASFAAYRAIKSRDPTAKILIVGDENRLPYMRPPLSKELWFNEDKAAVEELRFKQWNGRERSLFFELPAFYTPIEQLMDSPKGGISVLQGKRVSRIDAKAQVAHLEDGTTIGYDKCLIATGGKPKNLPQLDNIPAEIKDKVTLFRKIEDFRNLEAVAREAKSITIFGGGFLGSELACALGHRGKKIQHGGGPGLPGAWQHGQSAPRLFVRLDHREGEGRGSQSSAQLWPQGGVCH